MKPILFNTDMVRAILAGRKTVTRRLMKPQPKWSQLNMRWDWGDIAWWRDNWNAIESIPEKNKPLKVGDILYVRETWTKENNEYFYRADFDSDFLSPCETLSGGYPHDCQYYPGCEGCNRSETRIHWRPSIHMPKEAARIFLRVKSVRVERLQAITEEECEREGIRAWTKDGMLYKYAPADEEGDYPIWPWSDTPRSPTKAMRRLWDSTIKPADRETYGWEANPWVWVIEFERCERPKEG